MDAASSTLLSLSSRLRVLSMSQPEALDWSVDNCTVQRALQVLGDRWSFVVLREVFNGIRRFDDMRQRSAIPRQVLSDRLATPAGGGLLRREPHRRPGPRARSG